MIKKSTAAAAVFLYASTLFLLEIRKAAPINNAMGNTYAIRPMIPIRALLMVLPTVPPSPMQLTIRIMAPAIRIKRIISV